MTFALLLIALGSILANSSYEIFLSLRDWKKRKEKKISIKLRRRPGPRYGVHPKNEESRTNKIKLYREIALLVFALAALFGGAVREKMQDSEDRIKLLRIANPVQEMGFDGRFALISDDPLLNSYKETLNEQLSKHDCNPNAPIMERGVVLAEINGIIVCDKSGKTIALDPGSPLLPKSDDLGRYFLYQFVNALITDPNNANPKDAEQKVSVSFFILSGAVNSIRSLTFAPSTNRLELHLVSGFSSPRYLGKCKSAACFGLSSLVDWSDKTINVVGPHRRHLSIIEASIQLKRSSFDTLGPSFQLTIGKDGSASHHFSESEVLGGRPEG